MKLLTDVVIFIYVFITFIPVYSQKTNLAEVCNEWDLLDKKIVNKIIDKNDALDLLQSYEKKIINLYKKENGIIIKRSEWVYPLKYFTSVSYRDNGNDYKADEYDYFQGTNTKGHAAHDIFILDSDKDILDDSTNKPVDVISMSSGVVVATDTTWKPGSVLRGGLYVKVFDAVNKGIFYYSHLSKVSVKPGDKVNAGDKIGEVGRTGRKAILKEGKTHLHIGYLNSVNGYPEPEDILKDLKIAQKKIEGYR